MVLISYQREPRVVMVVSDGGKRALKYGHPDQDTDTTQHDTTVTQTDTHTNHPDDGRERVEKDKEHAVFLQCCRR